MIEPGRELSFAKEALLRSIVAPPPRMQHLDDDVALERWLRAAVDDRAAALADLLAKDELAQLPPNEICRLVCHRHQLLDASD